MSNSDRNAWFLAAAFILFAWSGIEAGEQERATREVAKKLTFSGGRISIDNKFGSVTVRTQGGTTVDVKATLRANASTRERAEEVLNRIRIVTADGASGVTIKTEYPDVKMHNFGFGVDYQVTIPAAAPLRVRNRFGSVDVAGVRAKADIGNAHGSVAFRDGKGAHEIENAFGSVAVDGNDGNVTVRDANGSVAVKNVAGDVAIENRFGSITATGIGDTLTVNGANGSVTIADVGGALKVTNSFGSISASKVRATIDITNSNGKIEVREIKGDARLRTAFASVVFADVSGNVVSHSDNSRVRGENVGGSVSIRNTFGSVELHGAGETTIVNHNGATTASEIRGSAEVDARFGLVRLEKVRGSVKVTNGNGSVNATGVGGSATVTTSFAPVFLKDVAGKIDVTNQNGSVAVALPEAAHGCQEVSIATAFGSLELDLPASANYDVAARTSFGRIRTDLPLILSSTDDNRLNGKLGKGGCRVELTNSNGSITIK